MIKIFLTLSILIIPIFSVDIGVTKIELEASIYSSKFENRKTSSGEIFHQNKYTAATNQLPLGTEVKVTRIIKKDTYSVVVKINDRTAKRYSHRIDLSKSAAKKLKISGIAPVTIEVL